MPSSRRKQPSATGTRRKRTVLTSEQAAKLEDAFCKEIWPTKIAKDNLAHSVGVAESFVCVWFQNRRARMRREDGASELARAAEAMKKETKPDPVSSASSNQSDCSVAVDVEAGEESMDCGEKSQQSSLCEDSILGQSAEEPQPEGIKSEPKTKKRKNNARPQGRVIGSLTTHPQGYCKILPMDSNNNGSGEPDDGSSIQNLLNLTKNLNNQMNWGTFGITSSNPKPQPSPGFSSKDRVVVTERTGDDEPNHIAETENTGPTSTSTTLPTVTVEDIERIREALSAAPEAPTVGQNSAPSPEDQSNRPTLFSTVMNMVAVAEGGIISLPIQMSNPEFNQAINNVLYGIRIGGSARLVYNKEDGFDIVDEIPLFT